MSATEYLVWFIAYAIAITTIIVVGMLGVDGTVGSRKPHVSHRTIRESIEARRRGRAWQKAHRKQPTHRWRPI